MNPTFVNPGFKPFLPDRSITELYVPGRDEISFSFLTDESEGADKHVRLPMCNIVFEHYYCTVSVTAYGNWQSIQEADYRQVQMMLDVLPDLYQTAYLVKDFYVQFMFKNALVAVAASPTVYGWETGRADDGRLFYDLLKNTVNYDVLVALTSEITCYGEAVLAQHGPDTFYPYHSWAYRYCIP